MHDNREIFLSSNLIPETDNDDKTIQDVIVIKFQDYEYNELIDVIGTENFKATFLNFIGDIKSNSSIDDQIFLCKGILEKLNSLFGIDFPENVDLIYTENFENVYDLIKFIEFDNVKFCVDMMKHLNFTLKQDIDIRNLDIDNFVSENIEEIIIFIDTIIKDFEFSFLVRKLFLFAGRDMLKRIISYVMKRNNEEIFLGLVTKIGI